MRYSEFRLVEALLRLDEAEARIQHAEDIIFWEGARGAIRAIDSLSNLEDGKHESVTIKWDGSPAIIFGRNEDGEFILTDKSGFGAKGYDGKSKSASELGSMLKKRPGYQKNPKGYGAFIANMTDIFDEYEKAIPKDFKGYFKGDLLYFNTPPVIEGNLTFTPNIVTYEVDPISEIGKRIAKSKTGVVVHRYMDESGIERPVSTDEINNIITGDEVLIFPPVTPQRPPQVNDNTIRDLKAEVSKNANSINKLLDQQTLRNIKLSDLSKIFYAYTNTAIAGPAKVAVENVIVDSKVNTRPQGLGSDFMNWIQSTKLSEPKKKRIAEYIATHQQGFNAMWSIIEGIIKLKNDIIDQFDKHDADITASIGKQKGGEGYVLAHPGGDIKLVNRSGFTAANRAVER